MPKKFAKRSKPSGPSAKKGVGGKGQGGRPKKKGAKKKGPAGRTSYGPPKKRVFRKRPPRPSATPATTGPREDGERLQKVLAAAGVASRRECEELITAGRVHVDGKIVTELGARVDLSKQTVHLDGELLTASKPVYFALNKPTGVVCTARDPAGRPRVTDLLPPNAGRVFAIGRLDMSSEGLILLTNDGELANRITHPRHGVEKLYHVQVAGMPSNEVLAEVRKGVYIDEGRVAFKNVKLKSTRKSSAILEVILDEGRNREIRRVLARVGHKVQKLQRIAVGPVRLGEMPVGAYRELTREEVTALREATTGKHKTIAVEKRPSGPRPDRKRPPRKAAPKKAERPAEGRAIIGGEESKSATERPKRPTARPAKHRPHKHGATGKPTGKPSGKPPIKKGVKKSGGKPFNKSKNKGRGGSGGGKPKGKR
ncbi:pseudouridine synthase [Botrimarina mediterranea]|uniref:Pseudouridine synthase n=1 Tax=Botrimarina mediterranea TaxID=2528022 RepID=A0A518KAW5_9BACT|nr:pseudouridine synthase [Botrimarina mediterranea]QDV74932.1 Ribosomal large subunit pseudouridine synthase B [Botrimarina mediterranea]QDV79577.1 Ribosomal large subunit pseudouridine synthase B [Planctomycetes bacterium K2D]